jgi:hypothetical protein
LLDRGANRIERIEPVVGVFAEEYSALAREKTHLPTAESSSSLKQNSGMKGQSGLTAP